MRLDYTDNKNEVRVRIYTSFDYAEMVLFDRPYCELGQQGKDKGWMRGEQGYTHDLRRVNARTDNFDTYFSVVLDDLLTVFHLQRCRSGSEALTWSWDVYDGGFEDGSNLRSGWRSCGEGVRSGITKDASRAPVARQSNSMGRPPRKCPSDQNQPSGLGETNRGRRWSAPW